MALARDELQTVGEDLDVAATEVCDMLPPTMQPVVTKGGYLLKKSSHSGCSGGFLIELSKVGSCRSCAANIGWTGAKPGSIVSECMVHLVRATLTTVVPVLSIWRTCSDEEVNEAEIPLIDIPMVVLF